MIQLRECSPRNHGANFGEGCVVPDAVSFFGDAEPDAATGAFDGPRQSAIVDDLAPNALDAANTFEGAGTNQDTAAGRRRSFAIAPRHPLRWIKHEEEKDE